MDIKQLQYFVTIVEETSISAAAKKLYMSQPPLSYQMRELEKELNCTLFERGSRQISLTSEGKMLYSYAQSILNLADVCRLEISSLAKDYQGTIRLGIVSSCASTSAVAIISSFKEINTHIGFEIIEANTYELLELVKQNRIHMAIVRTPYNEKSLEAIKIKTDSLIIACNDTFKSVNTINDLSKAPLIVYKRWNKIIEDIFISNQLSYHPMFLTDDARTSLALAKKNLGVALVPQSAVTNETMILKKIEGLHIESTIELVYNSQAFLPQYAKTFIDFIKQETKKKDCFA